MSTTFVLVHGAFGGSYGFREVRRRLNTAGFEAIAPSMTGIGERRHLADPRLGLEIDLALHVDDIANAIEVEDMHDIVLLGFSYGGMVVSGALERIADRVTHLVYLDAFVPSDGDSAASILGVAGDAMVASATDGFVPPIGRDLGSPEANAWSEARRVHQPVKTLTDPVSMSVPLEEQPFGRTFIKATADPAEPDDSPFWAAARHADQSAAWGYHEIDCNHMIPALRPAELTEILLDLVD